MKKTNDWKRIATLLGVVCLVSSAHGQFTLGGINTTMGVMGTLQSINIKSGAMLGAINEANRLALRGQRPGTDGTGPVESGGVDILGTDSSEPAGGQPDDPFASLPNPDRPFEQDANPADNLEELDPDSGLEMSDDPFSEGVDPDSDPVEFDPDSGLDVNEDPFNEDTMAEDGLEEFDPDSGLDISEDPFSEDVDPGADSEEFDSGPGLDPGNDPFDLNPPEDDMPGVGDKNSVDIGDSVEPPEDPENVYIAPNGKPFQAHWGAPPALQTRDLRPLPGGYGNGSSTLASWIQQNMEKDAEND